MTRGKMFEAAFAILHVASFASLALAIAAATYIIWSIVPECTPCRSHDVVVIFAAVVVSFVAIPVAGLFVWFAAAPFSWSTKQ